MEVIAGRYPDAIGFALSGRLSPTYSGLSCTTLPTTLTFASHDAGTVDGQIAQFLNATRKIDVENRKAAATDVRTKLGKRKKSFSAADWERVAASVGPTALLSLLYRKRIKANYRDIDTFLHPDLDAEALYSHLLQIVSSVNFIHEALIAKALGVHGLEGVISGFRSSTMPYAAKRLPSVQAVLR